MSEVSSQGAVKVEVVGQSAEGRSIELHRLTRGPARILLIGGVHGDEPEGVFLAEEFVRSGLWRALEGRAELVAIPRLNPDGCERGERRNSRGVDLNRNMPTRDWDPKPAKERYHPGASAGSELETQALINIIESFKPRCIFTLHSYDPVINYNGPCRGLALEMAKHNGYRIDDDIGYPTPGSLGTWAGWERQIPTITLEIERDSKPPKIWATHAVGLLKGMEFVADHANLDAPTKSP